MKQTSRGTVTILLAIVALILAGCTMPFAPPPTAAPPTGLPTKVAEATVTPVSTQTPVPTASPLPTTTLVPTDTPLPPSPTPTATTAATATALPSSPTPAATATATAAPQPTRSRPRPTATPEFSGKLVFQTALGGDLYVIDAGGAGGGPRRLTDGADPVWSPDGQQIAFVRWREPRGVWVIGADGSGERRVFDWSEARWPAWSPGGERILFSRQHGGRLDEVEECFWRWCFTFPPHAYWRLGIVRLGDGDFREPPASNFALAPDWSPDGQRFVYSDEHGLRVQREEDGDPYAASYLITHDARDTSPVWSPDGQRVAFTRRQHDHWEVYLVDADGANLRRLTDTPKQPDGSLGNSASPAWSPDGRHLAFLTDRTGRWEIWVMAAPDGTGAGGRDQRPMFKETLDNLTLEYAGLGDRAISWTR